MKIRHQIEAPELADVKERFLDSRWLPAAIMSVTAVICVYAANKQSQVIINNFKQND